MKEEKQQQTINIFISHSKIDPVDAASANHINFLSKHCAQMNIEFPFQSLAETKQYLKKTEVSRALKELLERGNRICFIYPYEGGSIKEITFFDSNIYTKKG